MIKEAKGRVYTLVKEEYRKSAYYENENYMVKKEVCDRKDIKLKGLHNVEKFY